MGLCVKICGNIRTGEMLFSIFRFAVIGLTVIGTGRDARSQGQSIEFVGQIGGQCTAVEVDDNYAAVLEGPNIQILDLSDPLSPIPVGRLFMPGSVAGMSLSGGLLFVAAREQGLLIYDIGVPSSPTLRGTFPVSHSAVGIQVSGKTVYVNHAISDHPDPQLYELLIIDVSSPSQPTLRGLYSVSGHVSQIYVSGGLAYLRYYDLKSVPNGNWQDVMIVDLTDPSQPAFRGSLGVDVNRNGLFAIDDTL